MTLKAAKKGVAEELSIVLFCYELKENEVCVCEERECVCMCVCDCV